MGKAGGMARSLTHRNPPLRERHRQDGNVSLGAGWSTAGAGARPRPHGPGIGAQGASEAGCRAAFWGIGGGWPRPVTHECVHNHACDRGVKLAPPLANR